MNKTRRKILGTFVKRLSEIMEEIEKFKDLTSELINMIDEIANVCNEEQEAFDNMPESLQAGEKGQVMVSAIGQMDEAIDAIGDIVTALDDLDVLDSLNVQSIIDALEGAAK